MSGRRVIDGVAVDTSRIKNPEAFARKVKQLASKKRKSKPIRATALTIEELEKRSWPAQVVEHYNPFARRTFDLFGIIDVVAIAPTSIVGIQCTSNNGGNHSSRITKALAEPRLQLWLQTGARFEVWSWCKRMRNGVPFWFYRRAVASLSPQSPTGVLFEEVS